jgi:hypothetical protein
LYLQEVAYQTFINGVGAFLSRDQKEICPHSPFYRGAYMIKCVKDVIIEAELTIYVFLLYMKKAITSCSGGPAKMETSVHPQEKSSKFSSK